MLTPRQRVYASIRRQGMDVIPWQFDLTSAVRDRLRAYYGTDDLLTATGDHMVWVGAASPPGTVPPPPAPDLTTDEFGVVWRRAPLDREVGDWGGLVRSPLSGPSLKGYRFPDGTLPGRWNHVPEVRRKHPDHFLVAGGAGLFERGWSLCGFEEYLGYIAGDEAFVEELADRAAQYSCAVTRQVKGLGVDGIRFGDDWGLQRTLMIQPSTWRRVFKKYYQRIYAAAREAGLVVMIHSCGNITDILPDLIEIGVEVVHPLQPEAMDVAHCQREFGRDLAFWGGLGSQSTLPTGTPEDVRREVRDRLGLFAAGGYILAPAGAAPAETPAANIAAIVDAARLQFPRKPEN